MKTIAFINQKGGVGKTTAALAVGAALQRKEYSVLYVDLDSQGNMSFTAKADLLGYNSMGVLQRPETAIGEVQVTEYGHIIASSPMLAAADVVLSETGKEYRLKEALSNFEGQYDYCLIDAPPSLGVLTVNALTACNQVIIPAQADIFSMQGIGHLEKTIQTVRKYCNPDLKIMGIVITRFNGRTNLSKEATKTFENMAEKLGTKLFRTKIRECNAIKEAQVAQENIFNFAPKSNAAVDFEALANEIQEEG